MDTQFTLGIPQNKDNCEFTRKSQTGPPFSRHTVQRLQPTWQNQEEAGFTGGRPSFYCPNLKGGAAAPSQGPRSGSGEAPMDS